MFYYSKAVNFIKNATSIDGFYEGIRAIMDEAAEKETPFKSYYPEDWQIKQLQRLADAKYSELERKRGAQYD